MTGPAISPASIGRPSSVVTMPTMSGSTRCKQQLLGRHAVLRRGRRRDDGEQRGVDAIGARGENAELAAFLAAVEQELARVLEVVAIDDFAQDALGREWPRRRPRRTSAISPCGTTVTGTLMMRYCQRQ